MRAARELSRLEARKSTRKLQPTPRATVCVGVLAGIDEGGLLSVTFGGNATHPVPARTTVPLYKKHLGREVLLVFEDGNLSRPIITGVLQLPEEFRSQINSLTFHTGDNPREAQLEADRFVFSAGKELVLRCGKASITLTQEGKVLIKGAYLLNSSSGVNRIRGGSVQIN